MENALETYLPLFYAANHIPFIWLKDEREIALALPKGDIWPNCLFSLKDAFKKGPLAFISVSNVGFYGKICFKSGDVLLLGPVLGFPVSTYNVSSFFFYFSLPHSLAGQASDFLKGIPLLDYTRFLSVLSLLLYSVDGQSVSLDSLLEGDKTNEKINKEKAKDDILENEKYHGTYNLERQLISLVKDGNSAEMDDFLKKEVTSKNTSEGKLAEDQLRQAKNIFIGFISMVGKDGAIQGGLGIETTYALIDSYIQQCENCTSVEQVMSIQYQMLLEFTKRVEENKLPASLSDDVYQAVQFVLSHLHENIGIREVVAATSHSKSWLTSAFRKELHLSINEYITKAKLAESKRLLIYSDSTISEIAYSLAFSSQSYFQNQFKKAYKLTPLSFRKNKEKK